MCFSHLSDFSKIRICVCNINFIYCLLCFLSNTHINFFPVLPLTKGNMLSSGNFVFKQLNLDSSCQGRLDFIFSDSTSRALFNLIQLERTFMECLWVYFRKQHCLCKYSEASTWHKASWWAPCVLHSQERHKNISDS